jgi:hypothetical protein
MVIRKTGLAVYLVAAVCSAHGLRAQQPVADVMPRDSLPAVLIGHVTDSTGVGLPGAELTLFHSDKVRAITGDSGEFRLTGLPAGTNVFNVRRLGFEAASFTAVLRGGKTHRATFRLTATAHALPAVAVADTAVQSHWLDQFDRRRAGATGTFFTRADIVRKQARTGTDIVRNVPGVRLVPVRGGGSNKVVMNRGSGARTCYPQMFYHNMAYSGDLDDFMAEDIEALEVYVGVAEIPPELDKGGKGICGAIVVWTRDPKKVP